MANETDEKIHGEQRRLVARAYAMESMVHLEPMINTMIDELLGKLRGLQGKRIDLGYWMQLYAFGAFLFTLQKDKEENRRTDLFPPQPPLLDVIGSITFSRPFGFLASGTDNGLFHRLCAISLHS